MITYGPRVVLTRSIAALVSGKQRVCDWFRNKGQRVQYDLIKYSYTKVEYEH